MRSTDRDNNDFPGKDDGRDPWLPRQDESWRVPGLNVPIFSKAMGEGAAGEIAASAIQTVARENCRGFGQGFSSREERLRYGALKEIAERFEARLDAAAEKPVWQNSWTCIVHYSPEVLQSVREDLGRVLEKFYSPEVARAFRSDSNALLVLRELRMDFATAYEVPLLWLVMRLQKIDEHGHETVSRQIP